MKKVFGILAILSLLMVPCVSMAATMSDADLASVTGQAGVTITVSNLSMSLGLNSFTYGDENGYTGATGAGFINVEFVPVPMHIGIDGLTAKIDVGTGTVTSINMNIKVGTITLDAIAFNVYLDGSNAVLADYMGNAVSGASAYTGVTTKNLGWIGISGIELKIPSAFDVTISAH